MIEREMCFCIYDFNDGKYVEEVLMPDGKCQSRSDVRWCYYRFRTCYHEWLCYIGCRLFVV